MDGAIDEEIKDQRLDELMQLQQEVSFANQQKMIGKTLEVLVEDQDGLRGVYRGRSVHDAPDEVDGVVLFTSERAINFGEFVKVKITEAMTHDLKGVEVC